MVCVLQLLSAAINHCTIIAWYNISVSLADRAACMHAAAGWYAGNLYDVVALFRLVAVLFVHSMLDFLMH
jgi:hypothetical protein